VLYVVVIELEGGEKDYKVFGNSGDAIRRHDTAWRHMSLREPVSVSGREEAVILSCGMFRAESQDVREAVAIVKSGLAKVLEPEEFYADRDGVPTIDQL
jgi:hypothetical protein